MTNISLSLVAFVNIFMIPIIGLRLYTHRHGVKWENSSELRFMYCLLCVLNLLVGRVVCVLIEMFLLVVCTLESIKYTFIGMCTIILIVLNMEIVEEYIQLHISISLRKTESKEKTKSKKELIDEK